MIRRRRGICYSGYITPAALRYASPFLMITLMPAMIRAPLRAAATMILLMFDAFTLIMLAPLCYATV